MRPKLLTLKDIATVRLERGGTLVLRGNPWARDFTIRDGNDAVVLAAEPRTSPLSLHQYDYAVREVLSGVLLIPEMIAVVQIWRMIRPKTSAYALITGR